MIKPSFKARAMAFVILAALIPIAASATSETRSWDFRVLLDGDKIGYHRFELENDGELRRLTSEAKFDVRFLFINAFRYRHQNTEIWADGCLQSIDARTQSNGKKLSVLGERDSDGFLIDDGSQVNTLDDCVMTFAYWNPEFLRQQRLLNPQSGEYLDVIVEEVGSEPITVRGEQVPASVYRVTANKMELKLWYSPNDEWLALESIARGGRVIRYELT